MSRRDYITRRRIAELAIAMSERDHQIVRDVAKLNLVSGQQVRRLHYAETAAGRRLARMDLARLVEWRVITRLGRRVGGERAGSEGFVYAIDIAGQRLVQPGRLRYREPWTPQPNHLRHALDVSELYVRMRTGSTPTGWRLEHFDAEPACWRRFHGPGGARLILKPDAFIITRDAVFEDRYFIEVDRATESTTRIADKARTYVRYWQSGREQTDSGVFPEVLWVVPDERRRAVLVETLARLRPEHWQLFAVTTQADARAYILGHADAPSASLAEGWT